jgi:integrase
VANLMRECRDEHGTMLRPSSDMTLSEYLTAWLDALVVRPNTYKLRKHLISKHIVPHIGARSLVDIRFLVRRWKDDAVGATTQRTALVTLSSALNVALREEEIGRNPCSTVPTPKPKRPEVLVLDGQQVMQLLGATARDV